MWMLKIYHIQLLSQHEELQSMPQPQRYGYKQFTVGQSKWVTSHPQPSVIWTDKKEKESRK